MHHVCCFSSGCDPEGEQSTASGSSAAAPTESVGLSMEQEIEVAMDFTVDAMSVDASPPPPPRASEPPALPTANLHEAILKEELLPSDLYTPELERRAGEVIDKLDDAGIDHRIKLAKEHVEYGPYCRATLKDGGLEEGDWHFGEEEPYLDLIGFEIWCVGKAELLKRLAATDGPSACLPLASGASSSGEPATMQTLVDDINATVPATLPVAETMYAEAVEPETQPEAAASQALALQEASQQALAPEASPQVAAAPASHEPSQQALAPEASPQVAAAPAAQGASQQVAAEAQVAAAPASHEASLQPLAPVASSQVAPATAWHEALQQAAPVASSQVAPALASQGASLQQALAPVGALQQASQQALAPQAYQQAAPASQQALPPQASQQALAVQASQQALPAAASQQALPAQASAPLQAAPGPVPLAVQPLPPAGVGAVQTTPMPMPAPAGFQPGPRNSWPVGMPPPQPKAPNPHPPVKQQDFNAVVPLAPAVAAATAVALGAAPSPGELAERVDAVADGVSKQTLPNSVTHRKEWATYTRQAKNPQVMQAALLPMFNQTQGKLDLFRLWLQKAGDWTQVELEVQRKNIQRESATHTRRPLSRRQLEQDPRYTAQDLDDLCKRCEDRGLVIYDPNFPQREDLRLYIITDNISHDLQQVREETQQMTSTVVLDAQQAMAVTEQGSDLAFTNRPSVAALQLGSGGAPTVAAEQGSGSRNVPEPKEAAKKPKPKRRGKKAENEGEPQPDKVPSPLEKATALKRAVCPDSFATCL